MGTKSRRNAHRGRPAQARRISGVLLALLASVLAPDAMAQLCTPGHYSPTGSEPCIPAPAGRFVSGFGATTASLAPIGFFVPTSGRSAATPAPVGYFVNTQGAVAPSPAEAGFYVGSVGQTSAQSCPEGSWSYGAGSACRRVAPGTTGPQVVGPAFDSSLGTGGSVSGLVFDKLYIDIFNDTTDTASPANLTDLNLTDFVLTGADASLFQLFLPADTTLSKGEHATLVLDWIGPDQAPFAVTLTVKTDQDACNVLMPDVPCSSPYASGGRGGGGNLIGTQFAFDLSGRGIPEPASLALAGLALAGLSWSRRRQGRAGRPAAA